jgi:hypothetical protein
VDGKKREGLRSPSVVLGDPEIQATPSPPEISLSFHPSAARLRVTPRYYLKSSPPLTTLRVDGKKA